MTIVNMSQVDLKDEPRFLLAQHKNLMYCSLTKCGSTNWKSTLRDIEKLSTGRVLEKHLAYLATKKHETRKDNDARKIRRRSMSEETKHGEVLRILGHRWTDFMMQYIYHNVTERYAIYTDEKPTNYFKFLMVRDPLERLLSAYRDKYQPRFFLPLETHPEFLNKKELMVEEIRSIKHRFDTGGLAAQRKLIEMDSFSFQWFLYYLILRVGVVVVVLVGHVKFL